MICKMKFRTRHIDIILFIFLKEKSSSKRQKKLKQRGVFVLIFFSNIKTQRWKPPELKYKEYETSKI